MKKNSFFIPVLVALICFSSCKKDKAEPSFVDDYNAPLTEEKGTEHNGDYFPIEEGYSWNYSGTEEVKGEVKYSGGGYSETEPIDEIGPVYSSISVEPITSVTLASGNYMLYPVKESYYTSYQYRYFEKKDDGVYFRAFMSPTEEIIEVENPAFIKKPLVVGDSWETQPVIDLNSALSENEFVNTEGEFDATIKCKTYVIGKEKISWNGQSADPLRLDQLSEAKLKLPYNEEGTTGTIDMNLKMTYILYLLENVGLIKQDLEMDMTMNFSISAGGQKGSIKMTASSKGDLNLDSYDVTGTITKESIIITDDQGNLLNRNENPLADKAVKKFLKVREMVKKLTKF